MSALIEAATFTRLGCYKSSSVQSILNYEDDYTYQSSSHCEGKCSDNKIAALSDGKYCYCGDSEPDGSDKVSDSNCDVVCQGYPYENCGGNGYFLIYSNQDIQSSSSVISNSETETQTESSSASSIFTSASSSLTSSSTASSATSTATSSSSSGSSTTSSSSSKSKSASSSTTKSSSETADKTTIISTVTQQPTGTQMESVIAITRTILPSTTQSTPTSTSSSISNLSSNASSRSDNRSLSTGGIVGIVIGSLSGLALLASLLFFLLRYKGKKTDEDKDDEFTLSGEKMDTFNIGSNPFFADQNQPSDNGHHSSNGNVSNSFTSTNRDDVFMFATQPNIDITGDNNKLSSEFGRRRLSNGSLPDMVTRNPGSLKVVNN